MVRASQQEQTGGVGISEVSGNFERIGWGPIPVGQHDLGTDLLIQTRDDRRFDRGLLVGVQVKAGESYFEQPDRAEDGSPRGWWYAESDVDHFDYWVTHQLPHLLVLHNLDTRTSYWVHVTAQAVRSTGKGAKILVPADQTIDAGCRDALLAMAASSRPVNVLERTAWTAGADNIPPARRLRYALLVPRLVAPHPNTGYETAIGPEEAVALLVLGRVQDFDRFANRHAGVPGRVEAAASRDWRWRFVAALGCLLIEGDRSAVTAAIEDAPDPACRAAACVVTACALLDTEDPDAALRLLLRAAQPDDARDDAGPVDWAWTRTQLARARADIGKVATARQDAAAALLAVVGDADDLTASAVSAAAAQLLFQTAPWGQKQPEEVITASDTAVSWWRSRMLSTAFTATADRAFRQWAQAGPTGQNTANDQVNNQLLAAVVSAHLAGEHSAWRANLSLLARESLVIQHARGDLGHQTDALDELRRSGDAKALKLAAEQLWAAGPLEVLIEAARRVPPGASWTHTTALANLALWEHAGDVLDAPTATSAARFCLEVLADDTALVSRTSPTFNVAHYTLKALAGLVGTADDALQDDLVELLAGQPPMQAGGLAARGWACVVASLPTGALATPAARAVWHQIAATQPNPLAVTILRLLARDGDQQAHRLLLARVAAGDNDALAALGDPRQVDPDVAERLLAQDARTLEAIATEARNGVHRVRSHDAAWRLVALGSRFPDRAPWDALLGFLREDRVPAERKRSVCLALAAHADRLPEAVRVALRDLVSQLKQPVPATYPFGMPPFGGAAVILGAAVGAFDDEALAGELTALLSGSWRERGDAAMLIGHRGRSEFTAALVALLGDPRLEVRGCAACALAQRVARPDTSLDPVAVAGLRQALAANEAKLPLVVAESVAAFEEPSDQARELLAALPNHLSALVRQTATCTVGTDA